MPVVIADVLSFLESAVFADLLTVGKAVFDAIEAKGTSAQADITAVEDAVDAAEAAKVGA